MTSDYRPIPCDRHSELELLALRSEAVEIDAEGLTGTLSGRVTDVLTRDGAEYLVVAAADGERHRLRLDRLRTVRRLRDGGLV